MEAALTLGLEGHQVGGGGGTEKKEYSGEGGRPARTARPGWGGAWEESGRGAGAQVLQVLQGQACSVSKGEQRSQTVRAAEGNSRSLSLALRPMSRA